MDKKKVFVGLVGGLSLAAALFSGGLHASPAKEAKGGGKAVVAQADVIKIDVLKQFGPLEEPAVAYSHDKHTAALAKIPDLAKNGCANCHKTDEKTKVMSLKYMRLEDSSKADVRQVYHSNCISCHNALAGKVEKTGPRDAQCRGCHVKDKDWPATEWHKPVVDRGLHWRHARTAEKADNKCGDCHHVWDKTAKKVAPAAKEEDVNGSCNYCHEKTDTVVKGRDPEKIRANRAASHYKCVSCHLKLVQEGKKESESGPVKCEGCHGTDGLAKVKANTKQMVEQAKPDLRMKRKQPDAALILASTPAMAKSATTPAVKRDEQARMGAVAFNHKFHEENSATCNVCHHASLQSCSEKCHQPASVGPQVGKVVNLAQAMHSAKSEHSCVGCHAKKQLEDKNCAGCHAQRKMGLQSDTDSCGKCHMKPDAVAPTITKADGQKLAAATLEARKPMTATFANDDIPEKVTINSLADQYEPTVLEHRKIVLSLQKVMKDSKLSNYQHIDEGSVCRGCHHNAPADNTKKPPRCGTCHAANFNPEQPTAPGLKHALHNQCMKCHTAMGIEGVKYNPTDANAKPIPKNTDCEGCHVKKK